MKTDPHWKKIGLRPHHGICLPLWALRTSRSSGVGEFLDLIPMIEWCQNIGFDCLQLLPLNDTGLDLSPYNPLTSCALDPIHLSLWDLAEGVGFDSFLPYTQSPRLHRREVKLLKLAWLRVYFEKRFASISATSAYAAFLKKSPWLHDYARFMANKTAFQWQSWQSWPAAFREDPAEIEFHKFLQYLCFSQFEKVRKIARSRSLFLVGDTPYLLSPDSADVWAHPHLFRLDLAAGAPPDKYNIHGQNWGFPLFNWEEMEKTHFSWCKVKLSTLQTLYDIYRIDHVVGFFRIWAIAKGRQPSDGSFIPADPTTWISQGRKILEMMIDSCPLLPIAEDLGTIPDAVFPVLKGLGIPGTKVLRWQDSIPYDLYEPLSLTTVSTPDMEPLPLWWQNRPEEATAFCKFKGWHYTPTLSPPQQLAILQDAHHTSSYFHINLLQEYLFPFPELHSPSLDDERINVPGTLLPANWTYRFRPSVEEIVSHEPLAHTIRGILRP
jgi:4-alpha-glucanotransferase